MTVTRLAGMPALLAVAPQRRDMRLYIAEGSLVELAGHPLHRAWYADASRPSLRRRGSCTNQGPLSGSVGQPAGATRLALTTPAGERLVRVDARSRIVNRPAYQPVLPGQRLRIALVRCGPHRIADRIRFTGATIRPRRYEIASSAGRGTLPVLIAAAATMLLAIPVLFLITRTLKTSRRSHGESPRR